MFTLLNKKTYTWVFMYNFQINTKQKIQVQSLLCIGSTTELTRVQQFQEHTYISLNRETGKKNLKIKP